MSIKPQWLLHCILLTHAYLTGLHTPARTHTPLTRLSLGSWCWVSWWSPATLEKDREGGNGKRPLVSGGIFVFSSQLSRNPSIPAGPRVCFHSKVFFPLHVSPSSLLPSNNLTAPTGWGAFLTSCCLTLPSLSSSDTLTGSQMIHKQMILPCRNVPFHLIYTAILSQLFGIESDNRKTQACQDKTYI